MATELAIQVDTIGSVPRIVSSPRVSTTIAGDVTIPFRRQLSMTLVPK